MRSGKRECSRKGSYPSSAAADAAAAAWLRAKAVLLLVCLAALGLLAGLTACGSGLTADSSCKDFLNAPIEDQDEAVSSIAADVGAGNAVTPLGRPNIDYICANNPDETLGEAIEATG